MIYATHVPAIYIYIYQEEIAKRNRSCVFIVIDYFPQYLISLRKMIQLASNISYAR